ncbi:nuclear transport factor 2 family protein [Duganella sp. sic0402]|nr:nuclear transport factor 2 family protein [Duganella sp. sic0402]
MVTAFVDATNRYDVASVLALFAPDALIDDPSTGHCFNGHAGIRRYIERYFLGYQTRTRLISMERQGKGRVCVRLDFTGSFGHEIGLLDILVNSDGLIHRIDASLE